MTTTHSATGAQIKLPPLPESEANGDNTVNYFGKLFAYTADDMREYARAALARAGQQAGEAAGGVKPWQERMPAPWIEKVCDMNCSPRPRDLSDCPDCVGIKRYGDAVAARDAEIADLRAQLASARESAFEEAASIAEKIEDGYRESQGTSWPELRDDAETGARACADAIRSLTNTTGN